MLKLHRDQSFWTQPWFLVIAIVAGQVYAGWWMSLGEATPRYVPSSSMVVAQVDGAFDVTVTAFGLGTSPSLRSATN